MPGENPPPFGDGFSVNGTLLSVPVVTPREYCDAAYCLTVSGNNGVSQAWTGIEFTAPATVRMNATLLPLAGSHDLPSVESLGPSLSSYSDTSLCYFCIPIPTPRWCSDHVRVR